MYFAGSPIPRIAISPAPPEDPVVEPYSPFTAILSERSVEDGFRPVHLTPPSTTLHFKFPFEPKFSEEIRGIGFDNARFQQMLKATRERTASVGLRKELAIRVQKNKQAERRALFLSKLATLTPKTPPESPAVFHYTMPSPGLTSPLALSETFDKASCEVRVERVDVRDSSGRKPAPARQRSLPSLEQISARLIPSITKPSEYDANGPLFEQDVTTVRNPNSRPVIGIGRLRMPLRPSQLLPRSPQKLVVTNTGYTALSTPSTEAGLETFTTRGQRAHDMLCTLRKRAPSLATKVLPPSRPTLDDDESRIRRYSAPANMANGSRIGFEHPVLALPGGF